MADDGRLQRLLGGAQLASLRQRLRLRLERQAPSDRPPGLRLGSLTAEEHAALAGLQGRPARFTASMLVDLGAIDSALRLAGVADSLRDALERLDGPIVDRAAGRAALQDRWRVLVASCGDPALAPLLRTTTGLGLVKRLSGANPATAARQLADAGAVLRLLPAQGITRARLAASALGDAHALDSGCAVATLVLTVLRSASTRPAPCEVPDGHDARAPDTYTDTDTVVASTRDLWAGAGVLVNELARPALVLNLPGHAAGPGDPAYLSLRRLLRAPPAWAVRHRTVFVCENPNLLAIAADQLGPDCAPLVCTDGMPAAAQRTLLRQLTDAGATLHYHGDFDWPGLHIGNHVLRVHGARPWRFGAGDYATALLAAPLPGRTLEGSAVEASWDSSLAPAMREALRAVDEEMVADVLLQDLASRQV